MLLLFAALMIRTRNHLWHVLTLARWCGCYCFFMAPSVYT